MRVLKDAHDRVDLGCKFFSFENTDLITTFAKDLKRHSYLATIDFAELNLSCTSSDDVQLSQVPYEMGIIKQYDHLIHKCQTTPLSFQFHD